MRGRRCNWGIIAKNATDYVLGRLAIMMNLKPEDLLTMQWHLTVMRMPFVCDALKTVVA